MPYIKPNHLPEKRIAKAFRSISFAIRDGILSTSSQEFSRVAKIHPMEASSLFAKGVAHEKVSVIAGFHILQLTGRLDDICNEISQKCRVNSILPPSSSQDLDTSELRIDHAAYINLLKVYESIAIKAIHEKKPSDNIDSMHYRPDSFVNGIATIGEWARWVTIHSLGEIIDGHLSDTISFLNSAKGSTNELQSILDRSSKNEELSEQKRLSMEMALNKNFDIGRSPGLSFTPQF